MEKDAKYLGVTQEQFVDSFLNWNEQEEKYQTKHKPCDFLQEDGIWVQNIQIKFGLRVLNIGHHKSYHETD